MSTESIRSRPWCSNWIQEGNSCGDVDHTPCRNFDLGYKNWRWYDDTVEHKCHGMGYNPPNDEKAVYQIDFLPWWYFLQHQEEQNMLNYMKTDGSNDHKFVTFVFSISLWIFLNKFAGPQDHRNCWLRNAFSVLGNSLFTCNRRLSCHRFKGNRVEFAASENF